ncbi:aldo/keto reductase [Anaerosacchariphilus polymeriproducens]|uniref:Aldo/keto reductase n=1 Tax=Anaerosacchariphilus polymeriproducens TaxID=1812858 RepID=A0A371AUT1_9FIRM|nr:aldo/keto reductase [Anaerosacchariphilus polymeriproducens]RDU23333.1 aldo/keto reductase [Anaerosacchariphilus polymeriproducens]
MKKMLELRNHMQIPTIGFGTYKSTQARDIKEFEDAIRAGNRYFDTASFYGNEEKLGSVLNASNLPRESFQIASKVWKEEMGYENTLNACKASLKRLQMNYIDVYLVHWPKADIQDENWKVKLLDTWKAMEECYEAGLVKAIGVSNFLPHHLDVIMEKAKVQPMINQLEFHPGYIQAEAVLYSQKNDIVVQAWSPLGRTKLFEDPLLVELAEKYQVSVAQICLRFAIQQQVMPLPKSSNYERMLNNLDVFHFEIQEEDMERIQKMPQTGWSGEHPDRERVKFL